MNKLELREYITNRLHKLATEEFKRGSDQREEAYSVIDDLVKLFSKHNVSNQRKMLIDFQNFIQTQQAIYFIDKEGNADKFLNQQ